MLSMFYDIYVKITEILKRCNLLKYCNQTAYSIDFCIISGHFYYVKIENIGIFFKTSELIKTLVHRQLQQKVLRCIMTIVWLKSLDMYSSYCPETKWACFGQITPSKFDEICPLAIPNQISTIPMHHSKFGENPLRLTRYHLETKYGWTDMYDWRTDRYNVQHETIIPHHYRVAGYKNSTFWNMSRAE